MATGSRWRHVPFPTHLIHLLVFMLGLIDNIAVVVNLVFLLIIVFTRRHLILEELVTFVAAHVDLEGAILIRTVQGLAENLSNVIERSAMVRGVFIIVVVIDFILPINLLHVIAHAGVLLITGDFFEVMVIETLLVLVIVDFIVRIIIVVIIRLVNDLDFHTITVHAFDGTHFVFQAFHVFIVVIIADNVAWGCSIVFVEFHLLIIAFIILHFLLVVIALFLVVVVILGVVDAKRRVAVEIGGVLTLLIGVLFRCGSVRGNVILVGAGAWRRRELSTLT